MLCSGFPPDLTIFNEVSLVQQLARHPLAMRFTMYGAVSDEQMHAICQLRNLTSLALVGSRHGSPGTHGVAAVPVAITQLQSLTKLQLCHVSNDSPRQLLLPAELTHLTSLKDLHIMRVSSTAGLSTVCGLSAVRDSGP